MREFKGSKGEWFACCTEKGSKSHYVFSQWGDGGTVCSMMSNDPNDINKDCYSSMSEIVTNEERQANAKLIAAAPELLRMIIEMQENSNAKTPLERERFYKVEKLINKALGE